MSDEANAPELTEEQIAAKWQEISPYIDKMAERIADPNEFPVHPGSSLFGDDKASTPYAVSHVARACLVSGVDHLHAVKSLVLDLQVLHASALYTLARGSLENLAAAFWVLHPTKRNLRIERTLRWHAKNFLDARTALEPLGLASEATRDRKLQKLYNVGKPREIGSKTIRAGYQSSVVVEYAEAHSPDAAPLLPWRVCSGFAHGRPWAVLGMSEQEQCESIEPGVINLKLTSDLGRVLYPTLAAFRLMADVVGLMQQRSQSPT